MKFTEIRLKNFGQFHHKTIELKDGIQLIYGENEAGKSTIHSFIRGMLFGIEKQRGRAGKDDMYSKYQPWDNPTSYEGMLDIELHGKAYSIYRRFTRENKAYSVTDKETGRKVAASDIKGVSFVENLTEDNYRNTISIEQCKARTDKELAEEVSNYITNLSTTGSNQVNINKALDFLAAKKKAIPIKETEAEISEMEQVIENDRQDEAYLEILYDKQNQIEEKMEEEEKAFQNEAMKKLSEYIGEFKEVKEAYKELREAGKGKIRNSIYLLPLVFVIVFATLLFGLSGFQMKNLLYLGIVTILSFAFTYILVCQRNKDTYDYKKTEEYILGYGSRICEFDKIDEDSMIQLEAEVKRVEEQLSLKRNKQRSSHEETLMEYEKIKWELESYEQRESEFYDNRSAYKNLIEVKRQQEKELKAIEIARTTIQEIGVEIHDGFGHNLNNMISEAVCSQTSGKYQEIKIDEKLNIKVLHDGNFIELDKLSIGTIEQIYLALRLAAAKLLYGKEDMPLLFDDTFAFYDDNRLSTLLEMLSMEQNRQILIFTCQKREEEILKSLNLPYHKCSL